jgi:hypothetical protein
MKTFQVDTLMAILDDLYQVYREPSEPEHENEIISGLYQDNALSLTNDVIRLCDCFDFKGPLAYAQRLKDKVERGCSFAELHGRLPELRSRIEDEFVSVLFLWIEESEMYSGSDLFGDAVAKQFPSTSEDIDEAGRCYAAGRYTACVFHLMRVAEAGLNAIGRRIGYADPRPMWEPVLTYIDKQLKIKYEEMSELFRGDIEFLSGIASHMHAVNLAWRRRVAHIEKVYTQDQAKRIYDATKGLMQHVAEKLSECES